MLSRNIEIILSILVVAALIISVAWFYSEGGFEPVLATVVSLIALFKLISNLLYGQKEADGKEQIQIVETVGDRSNVIQAGDHVVISIGNNNKKEEFPKAATDRIPQQEHTKYAKRELSKILTLRIFDPSKSRRDIQELRQRMLEGDLYATIDSEKTQILVWCAKLCAQDMETLALAKEIRDELKQTQPETDLSIVDALILQTEGQADKALQLIRDREDPDSKAVLFSILVRSRENQDALDWFDKQDGHEDTSFFTATGWINLAVSLAKVGRWDEAVNRLSGLESLWEQSPILAFVEGHLNAAMLLPDGFRKTVLDTIPLSKDISPILGSEAESHHDRAVTCFEFAEQKLKGIVGDEVMGFIADWKLWLRLMDPSDKDAQSAREEISQTMRDDKSAIGLMRFAWTFRIPFDEKPLREYLEERKLLGGPDDREILAEFLLSEQSLNPRDLFGYLEQHKEPLSRVLSSRSLTCMSVEALAKDGQTEKARGLLRDNETDLGEIVSSRLTVLIDSVEGKDPRKKLEDSYNRTGESIDLRNLIAHLKEVDDRVALLPLLRKLFEDERNIENAKDLIICLGGHPFFDYEGIIKFLDDNADILERSDKLRELKAWALFKLGRFKESQTINNDLLNRRKKLADLVLDINLAIASGEWERIPEIFNREWSQRNSHSPEMLMSLAQFAGYHGQDTGRALELAKLAAEKAPDNPDILAAAYYLHFQLGREEGARPEWIKRALELSSPDKGPIWSSDLSHLATELIPQRQDHVHMVERKLINGEIPTIIGLREFGQSLARFFLQIPRQNIDERDGRRRAVLPIVSCGHRSVKLSKEQTVGLDITSIMVLWHLGFLKKTLAAFQQVKLASNIMTLLMRDRQNVCSHQPSLIRDANEVRELVNQEQLWIASDLASPPQDIADEVGSDLAELLQTARKENGRVVCALPVHKVGSLTGQEADIKEYGHLIISVVDFCSLLRKDGKIESHIHDRAVAFLHSQNQAEYASSTESVLDGPVYVDDLALYYLQSAGALKPACSCGLDIRIHPHVLESKDILIREEDVGSYLSREIEGIRDALRDALESGKASFLPSAIHEAPQEEQNIQDDTEIQTMASLLKGCTKYDVLCADDRFLNRQPIFKGPSDREVPIACTLDVLLYMVSQGLMDEGNHWVARNKLRKGGFTSIPLEADELMHWLKTAAFDETGLRESAEMRIIRQSTARTYNRSVSDMQNNPTIDAGFSRTCVTAIRELWQETSLTIGQKKMLSDWVWHRLMVLPFLNPERVDQSVRGKWLEELVTTRLISLLSPPQYGLPQEQCVGYVDWVEQSVLKDIRPANAHIIKEAIKAVCRLILKLDIDREAFAHSFLKHIPASLHELVWTLEPEFGKYRIRVLIFENDIRLVDKDLFSAARKVLLTKKTSCISDIDGKDVSVSVDPKDGNIVLEWSPGDYLSPEKVKDKRLTLLSPDLKIRTKTLADMIREFGPTAPDFHLLLKEIETRDLEYHELQEIFYETANGVAATQSRLISRINQRSFSATDLLPQSLRYFEQFGGPIPDGRDAESYISEVLVPYRKNLLKRDLQAGLDFCCLGALRDDLLPGQWVEDIDNDSLWEALSSCDVGSDPFSLIGALDIALHRQDDKRFREFSVEAVTKLAEEEFGQPEGIDIYALLGIFVCFTTNRINLLEGGANQPGYWKRLHSLMQTGLIIRTFTKSFPEVNTDDLLKWAFTNMVLAGFYANLIDARKEPMLILQQTAPQTLRIEAIRLLALLKSRHEKEGRHFPKSQEIDNLLTQLTSHPTKPSADHGRPKKKVVQNITEKLENLELETENSPSPLLSASVTVSDFFTDDESEIELIRLKVKQIAESVDGPELGKSFAFLDLASFIAAENGDTVLADEIANALVRLAARTSQDEKILEVLRILLQSSAANKDENAWFRWLEEKLVSIAHSISNDSLKLLIQHLDEIRAVLPINLWVDVPARSIALAGAQQKGAGTESKS